jgi:hypothetical protein
LFSRYQSSSGPDRLSLISSITGSLASFGEMQRVTALCSTLDLVPEAVKSAQKPGIRTVEDLQPFLSGQFGPGWKHWAQGKGLNFVCLCVLTNHEENMTKSFCICSFAHSCNG